MKSNPEWLEWGRQDPLHGVATWPGRERGGASPWSDDDFYALGDAEWADFLPVWREFGFDEDHCVEFGCGAGRMTRCLAGQFAQVTALDISPEQIAYAQPRVARANVRFAVIDGVHLPLPPGAASAFFSTYVFQHFASLADARVVLAEAARVLAPGASLFLQAPIFRFPETRARGLLCGLHSLERRIAGWKVDWQRRRGGLVMRMLWYDRAWLAAELRRLGFDELQFRSVRMTVNGHWNDLLLARRT